MKKRYSCMNTKQQKIEEDPSLLKHTFVKTVRTFHQTLKNMCDTNSYWHWECYVICNICSLFHVQLLHIKLMSSSVVNFFRSLVHNTMSVREERGIVRPDMIHLLMQAKKGTLQADDNATTTGKAIKPSMCKM